jgi:prevent-host-death family protein
MPKLITIAMSEARPKLTQIVEDADNKGQSYVIISKSKPKAVLVGIDQYNEMIDRLERIDEKTRAALDMEDEADEALARELRLKDRKTTTYHPFKDFRNSLES